MDRGNVLIVTDRLRGPVIEDVADACRAADLRPVCWPPVDQRAGVGRPALLVGGLRPGERRIPPAMLSVAATAPDAPPLLLLCDEPLVRSTVTLHEGRVTLVEQPASRARLYSTVRILLTSPGEPEAWANRADAKSTLRARRRPHMWIADVGGETRSPFVLEDPTRGVVTIIPFDAVSAEEAEKAGAALRELHADDQIAAALAESIGTRAGILHLDAQGTEWSVWWPRNDAPLWVSSPRRLPNFFPLHTQAHGEVIRLAASHGDVAAAIGGPIEGELATTLAAAMKSGGPTLLDALLQQALGDVAACVIEVR